MADSPAPILVPLDGSKNSEAALAAAVTLAGAYGTNLRIVHVIDPETIEQPVELDRAREIFRDYIDGLMKNVDLTFDTRVVGGSPAREVLDFSNGARMVVLASHGRSGIKAALIGSVADKIVRGATVPTLVVPLDGPAIDSGPVVVGLDGSDAAEQGLAIARDIAALLKVRVALVRAYSVPPPAGIEFAAYPVDLTTSLKEAAEDYVSKAAAPGEQAYTALGSPVQAIADVATKLSAGLVVMTAHGKGFAHRVALGSNTDRAMHSLHRPLLVVPVE